MLKDKIIIALAHDIEFDDYNGLHELLVTEFAYMDERIDPPSSLNRLTPKNLREKASNEWLILALQRHELIGCLFARPEDSAVYIGKVAVRHDIRNHGVGQKLMERAQEIAIENNYQALELEVRVELTENQRYFEKLGFTISGENAHEGYERPTSYSFCKNIVFS